MFYRLDAAYKLAINSVEFKKPDRLKKVQSYINTFVKSYSESEKINLVNQMLEEVNTQLQSYSSKS